MKNMSDKNLYKTKAESRFRIMLTLLPALAEKFKEMARHKGLGYAETVRWCIQIGLKDWNREKFGYSGAEKKPSATSASQKENELLAMSDDELITHLLDIGYLPAIGSPWPAREEDGYVYREFFCQGEGKTRNIFFKMGPPESPNPSEDFYMLWTNMIKELKGKNLL